MKSKQAIDLRDHLRIHLSDHVVERMGGSVETRYKLLQTKGRSRRKSREPEPRYVPYNRPYFSAVYTHAANKHVENQLRARSPIRLSRIDGRYLFTDSESQKTPALCEYESPICIMNHQTPSPVSPSPSPCISVVYRHEELHMES